MEKQRTPRQRKDEGRNAAAQLDARQWEHFDLPHAGQFMLGALSDHDLARVWCLYQLVHAPYQKFCFSPYINTCIVILLSWRNLLRKMTQKQTLSDPVLRPMSQRVDPDAANPHFCGA